MCDTTYPLYDQIPSNTEACITNINIGYFLHIFFLIYLANTYAYMYILKGNTPVVCAWIRMILSSSFVN